MLVKRASISPTTRLNRTFNPTDWVAVDTETTGLHTWHDARPFSVGMCDQDGNTWYCEWPVNPQTREVCPDPADLEFLTSVISNESITKVYHNARFDIRMLHTLGVRQVGLFDDTFIAARVAFNLEPSYGLKQLAKKYADIDIDDEKKMDDAIKVARRRAQSANKVHEKAYGSVAGKPYNLSETAAADAWLLRHIFTQKNPEYWYCEQYCRRDCERTAVLKIMYDRIMETDEPVRLTYHREMDLWYTVWDMETRGISVSLDQVDREIEFCKEKLASSSEAMQTMLVFDLGWTASAATKFNPNSSQQLAAILYDGYGLPPRNGRSTAFAELEVHLDHPFVRNLITYRMHDKAINTFFNKFRELSTPDTMTNGHVLHPGLDQVGTTTARFSCKDPNLQQLSDPASAAKSVAPVSTRTPFGPREGYTMYCRDYSGQEVKIFADLSRSPLLLDAVARGQDLYEVTSNRAFGGKNNPHAVDSAITVLELVEDYPLAGEHQERVVAVWERYGWKRGDTRQPGARERRTEIARRWLAEFDWDVIAAEKTLGKRKTRSRSKIVFLGKIYGAGAARLAPLFGCSVDEAVRIVRSFDEAVPELKSFMQATIHTANTQGYILNPFGRKLRVDRDMAYRACNHLVQSTAADMVKSSMLEMDNLFRQTKTGAHLLLSVHDEVIWEVKKSKDSAWLHRRIQSIMEDNPSVVSSSIPYGPNLTLKYDTDMSRVDERWDRKVKVENP